VRFAFSFPLFFSSGNQGWLFQCCFLKQRVSFRELLRKSGRRLTAVGRASHPFRIIVPGYTVKIVFLQ